jgi:nucleotide-binding universal stress UspA family protein
VVRADGSETGADTLAAAVQLAAILGAALHVVCTYGALQAPSDADAALTAATTAARSEGLQALTHARRGDPSRALIAVAREQDADLLVVAGEGMSSTSLPVPRGVPDRVSHDAPCSVLIVRTD